MCRIAGYLGEPLPLGALLSTPPRSLREQAKLPRELPPGVIGSDGFGVGWFVAERAEPARLRSVLPIWVDENVDTLAEHVRSSVIVASSRTASRRMPVAVANTPPFVAGRTLLAHNGEIADFQGAPLDATRSALSASVRAGVIGNSDTEYLAALLHDRDEPTLLGRVKGMLQVIERCVQACRTSAQLNLIVATASELVVLRHAIGAHAPSLYARQVEGGLFAASEPLDDAPGWRALAPGELVLARESGGARAVEWSRL